MLATLATSFAFCPEKISENTNLTTNQFTSNFKPTNGATKISKNLEAKFRDGSRITLKTKFPNRSSFTQKINNEKSDTTVSKIITWVKQRKRSQPRSASSTKEIPVTGGEIGGAEPPGTLELTKSDCERN